LVKKIYELTNKNYETSENTQNAITKVIEENPDIVTSYKNGKGQVIGFLIGQVQKKLNGRGNPKLINLKLVKLLHV